MSFYIKIDENNNPIDHPIVEENLKYLDPDFDPNNLPEGLVVFNKTEMPILGVYEVLAGTRYVYQNGAVNEVHDTRQMTADEKLQKQQKVKDEWISTNRESWVFDEEKCAYVAPVPLPADASEGKYYYWKDSTLTWKPMPPVPDTEKHYTFNIETEQWELIVD